MTNCIFCKIATGEIPSVKIREDENYMAILDLFPNRKWMTLVIPKKHFDSDIFTMPDEELQKYILATKKVTQILKKWLKVKRIGIVVEWLEVNHAHFRLYPFYDNIGYPNGVGAWPQATPEELQQIAQKILQNQ